MKRSATKTWENIINSEEHWMEHQQARTKAEPAPRSTRADRLSTLIRCALRTRFVSCSCRSFASWVRTVRWESVSRWDHTFLFIKSFAIIISFLCFFENVGWLGFLVWSGAVVFFSSSPLLRRRSSLGKCFAVCMRILEMSNYQYARSKLLSR